MFGEQQDSSPDKNLVAFFMGKAAFECTVCGFHYVEDRDLSCDLLLSLKRCSACGVSKNFFKRMVLNVDTNNKPQNKLEEST